MPLNPEVAKSYSTTLKDDNRPHIFPGMSRKTIDQITVADIQKLHAKGRALDVFIPLTSGLPSEASVVDAISKATSVDQVNKIVGSDTRTGVVNAANAKKATFK